MILRRVTEHVKAQNWFAVGIDFLIVVVGVFIGIQVANWNQARGEEQRADMLEARLIAEFTRIESYIADNIRQIEGWQSAADRSSQDILAGDITANRDDLPQTLGELTGWLQPPGTSATYNEIISQGDMDLLESPELRTALLEYKIVAERHIDANLVLIQSVDGDMDLLHHIEALVLVPADERPERFTDALQNELASVDLYTGISNIARARRIDLGWHRIALEWACEVLQALEQPCAHADDNDDEGQTE